MSVSAISPANWAKTASSPRCVGRVTALRIWKDEHSARSTKAFGLEDVPVLPDHHRRGRSGPGLGSGVGDPGFVQPAHGFHGIHDGDRKSTRLNSSHGYISY